MTDVLPWRARLAAVDHSRGTSNKMIQEAMRAEIDDLRKLLAPEAVEWRKAKLARLKSTKTEDRLRLQVSQLRAEKTGMRRALDQARVGRDEWKAAAIRYQKQLVDKPNEKKVSL